MLLTPSQCRVLGCLVEKALATPQQYPLTENALLAACNQATNRDPVTSYEVGTVRRALKGLREHGLAREVHRAGERATKHRHQLSEALGVDDAAAALLCVLLLRGPQTVAELRTRTERLHRFDSAEAVEAALTALAERSEGPLVELTERRPGQKEARWAHLLTDPLAEDEAAGAATETPAGAAPPAGPRLSLTALAETVEALQARVESLEAELAALRPGASQARPVDTTPDQPREPADPTPPEVGSS